MILRSRKRIESWTLLPGSIAYGLSKYSEHHEVCDDDIHADEADEFVFAVPIDVELDKETWLAQRRWVSDILLLRVVEINPAIRKGVPILRGTRMTISQILGELADGRSTIDISDAFDIDLAQIRMFLEGIAMQFDRPF
jgi:uncharacterized protein (DUF433 family)